MKILFSFLLLLLFTSITFGQGLLIQKDQDKLTIEEGRLLFVSVKNDVELDWDCTKCKYLKFAGSLVASTSDSIFLHTEYRSIPLAFEGGKYYESYTYEANKRPLIAIAKSNIKSIIDYRSKESKSRNRKFKVFSGILAFTGIASGITASLAPKGDRSTGYIFAGSQLLASFSFAILAKRNNKKTYEFVGYDDEVWSF